MFFSFLLDSHTLPTQHGDFSSLGAGNLALIHYICAILVVSCALSFEMEKPRFEKNIKQSTHGKIGFLSFGV